MIHQPKPIKKRPPRYARAVAETPVPPQKKQDKKRVPITIAAIVLVIALIVGFFYYLAVIMPYQRVILTVGNENIKTVYFLRRVVANPNGDISSTLQNLTAELIISQTALELGIPPATPQDIDTFLIDGAKGTNDSISDADFNTWFDEQLVNTGLSAKEYREVARRGILGQRIADILSANVQSVVPQVHLRAIILSSNDAALETKDRIDGGEDFSAVAKDVSIDTTSGANGGDLGWVPTSLLSSQLSPTVDALDIGKCSDPVPYVQQSSSSSTGIITSYLLLMVSEKNVAMQVTDDQLTLLKNKAFTDWLDSQISTTQVTFHGLNGSTTLDSQTQSWLTYQVQKLIKKRPSTPTTSTTTTTGPATTTATDTSP